MSPQWSILSILMCGLISLASCSLDSLLPDDDGQCGKYKISCPLGKVCRIRKIYWPRKVQYPICVLRDTPAENRNTCRLPPAPGHCAGRFLRWFYNTHSGQCSFFYYSGCRGNDNNFMRRADCESTCLGLRELVIPPEATVLPPVDPLNIPVPSSPLSNLELVEAPTAEGLPTKKRNRKGKKRNRKDKRRKGKKRRNRKKRPQKYLSLNAAKISFLPAQKDSPNETKPDDKEKGRYMPTSLRKSIASGKYFRIFTILSRRHGNNVYRGNRSHRRRKHRRGRKTTPVAPPSVTTTSVI